MFNSSCEHGVTDIRRIELNEAYEFRFWTSRFGCNSRELVDALVAVGIDADAVAAHLGKTPLNTIPAQR